MGICTHIRSNRGTNGLYVSLPLKTYTFPANLHKAHDKELTSSADALQIIGCIPRSPSPGLAIELPPRETGRQSAVPKPDPTPDPSERDRRISALKVTASTIFKRYPRDSNIEHTTSLTLCHQAQLALLERSPKVKPELVASASGTASTRGVKREYDGVEVVSERKRNRPSGPIETVDLTDD